MILQNRYVDAKDLLDSRAEVSVNSTGSKMTMRVVYFENVVIVEIVETCITSLHQRLSRK